MKKQIYLAGASGLVGGLTLDFLLSQAGLGREFDVYEVGRRAVDTTAKAKFLPTDFVSFSEPPMVELSEVKLGTVEAGSIIGICCLGTTIKKAGSQEAFKLVDYQFVLNFARWIHSRGGKKFIVVSAMGASADSSIFYNRVKGQMETELSSLGFESLAILQPSLLLGERAEKRFSERLAIQISPYLSWMFVAGLKKYQPILATDVARCIISKTFGDWVGCHTLESDQISSEVHK